MEIRNKVDKTNLMSFALNLNSRHNREYKKRETQPTLQEEKSVEILSLPFRWSGFIVDATAGGRV